MLGEASAKFVNIMGLMPNVFLIEQNFLRVRGKNLSRKCPCNQPFAGQLRRLFPSCENLKSRNAYKNVASEVQLELEKKEFVWRSGGT